MKEYITIHNVGPLRHIEQLEILPLTVLIGESAIGKSTLMKVLVLMRYLYKRANIRFFKTFENNKLSFQNTLRVFGKDY